jgi:hypothetical protein
MEEETQQDEASEARPNEGEIEEAVKDVGLNDSPEDVSDSDEPESDDQA